MTRLTASVIATALLFPFCASAQGLAGPDRPEWAQGLRGWGEVNLGAKPGRRPLEALKWRRSTFVTQDGRDNIYLLDASSGTMQVWTPGGDKRDEWLIPSWEPRDISPMIAGFACDRRGETFVAAVHGKIFVFNKKEMISKITAATVFTGVILVHDEILAARVPLQFGKSEKDQKDPYFRLPVLLSRYSLKGEHLGDTLEPDKATGADAMSVAMTQDLAITRDDRDGAIWIADRHRVYRLRRLSSSGSVTGEWTSDRVRGSFKEGGELPDEIKKTFDPQKPVTTKMIDCPTLVQDLVARRGFTYALLSQGSVTENQVVDVFYAAGEGPLWRIALTGATGSYLQLAVTESGFWLFPVGEGTPRWLDRPGDFVMQQSIGDHPPDDDQK